MPHHSKLIYHNGQFLHPYSHYSVILTIPFHNCWFLLNAHGWFVRCISHAWPSAWRTNHGLRMASNTNITTHRYTIFSNNFTTIQGITVGWWYVVRPFWEWHANMQHAYTLPLKTYVWKHSTLIKQLNTEYCISISNFTIHLHIWGHKVYMYTPMNMTCM